MQCMRRRPSTCDSQLYPNQTVPQYPNKLLNTDTPNADWLTVRVPNRSMSRTANKARPSQYPELQPMTKQLQLSHETLLKANALMLNRIPNYRLRKQFAMTYLCVAQDRTQPSTFACTYVGRRRRGLSIDCISNVRLNLVNDSHG